MMGTFENGIDKQEIRLSVILSVNTINCRLRQLVVPQKFHWKTIVMEHLLSLQNFSIVHL